ncbi:MAG: hypothetical protein JSV16_03150 [Candidatus Hydrogenedentota bacterium]|nr:MAG: hypothetical protein JSV16_03150 [Candidatus Hydrogenedentota bacterium]
MGWAMQLLESRYLSEAYRYGTNYPEAVLVAGLLLFLVFHRKFRAALILAFGTALCFANYFVFAQYNFSTISLLYAVGFAGLSIFVLLLLAYQFLHSA